jgi:hypothetical protein
LLITARELVDLLATEVEPEVRRLMGVSATNTLTQSQKDKSTEWVLALKSVLFRLGTNRGCHVYCSGKGFSRELMLDVLWCRGSSACAGIALACESEWEYALAVRRIFRSSWWSRLR